MEFPARLVDGYRTFRHTRLPIEQNRYSELAETGQQPEIMIIGCCDSRVSPEVIFADEPTANLDTHTADTILDLMQTLNREQGVAFVIATHDPRVVARAARVVTLRDGKIMAAPA